MSTTPLLNRKLEGGKTSLNWYLSTGRLSTIYPFQLQTPLHRVSPLPHLFTPFASQSQFTFHIVPLLGDRRKPLKWRSVLLRIPNGPSLTPRPLRSTVREFLSQRPPASSPSSVPKAEGRTDRMLDINSEIRTPNTSIPTPYSEVEPTPHPLLV